MISFEFPTNWVYRGEGNCNVVLALPDKHKVLRIRKINQPKSFIRWLINWINNLVSFWYCREKFDDELRDLMFYKKIMRPLLGYKFVCDAEQIFLTRKQIRILETQLMKRRPDHRKKKVLQSGRAAIFEDYAFLPKEIPPIKLCEETFAIEIKPKQGWAPFSEKRSNKCSYCMKQYLKLRDKEIVNLSSYCPDDLFSGEMPRMLKAIKALINNPQNNLRIFKNGEFCYGENSELDSFNEVVQEMFQSHDSSRLLEEFCLLIQKCLTKTFDVDCNNSCKNCSFVKSKLPKGSVLERIFSLQKLNFFGNECYYKLLENRNLNDYSYVKELLDKLNKFPNTTCLKCSIISLRNEDNDLFFVPYLISAIAKDCSIMLTFKKIEGGLSENRLMNNIVNTEYGNFIYNIGIFDLYPKPMSTIRKYKRKIDEMIVCSENKN